MVSQTLEKDSWPSLLDIILKKDVMVLPGLVTIQGMLLKILVVFRLRMWFDGF